MASTLRDRTILTAAIPFIAACALAPALAGDLAPPAGPVAPTMKTLQEVEPRTPIHQSDIPLTIAAPGSYYLTENLYPTAINQPAVITIAAPDVTLDLRGFTIHCISEVSSATYGVRIDGTEDVAVFNGVVIDAGNSNVSAFNSSRCRFSALRLSRATNTNLGGGNLCIVEDCHFSDSGNIGITVINAATIRNCVATGNAQAGFACQQDCTLIGCTARDNGGAGFDTGEGSVFTGCTAADNTGRGFDAQSGSSLRACAASGNGAEGFFLASDCTIDGCAADGNGVTTADTAGIRATSNLSARSCSVSGGDSNTTDGIRCTSGQIDGCTVRDCGDDGISMTGPGAIRNCTVSSCVGDGIQVSTGCIVERCNSSDNSQAGIHVTFQGNSIRENLCRSNLRGIDVDSTSNVIVRNLCPVNGTDYDVVGGNIGFAPVQPNAALAGPWDNM